MGSDPELDEYWADQELRDEADAAQIWLRDPYEQFLRLGDRLGHFMDRIVARLNESDPANGKEVLVD